MINSRWIKGCVSKLRRCQVCKRQAAGHLGQDVGRLKEIKRK